MTFTIGTAIAVGGLALSATSIVGASKTAGIQAAASMKAAKYQKELNELNTEVSNANSNTQRAIQVINNNRALRVAGKQFDAASQNIVRNKDAHVRGSIEQQIQQSEAAGAYAANLASKGVGGASADAISMTLALQQSRQRWATKQTKEYLDYDQAKQQAGIMPSAMNALDQTVYSGSVDNTVVMPEVRGGTDYAGIGATLLNSNLAKAIPDLYAKYTATTTNPAQGLTSASAPYTSFFGTGGSSAGLSGIKLR